MTINSNSVVIGGGPAGLACAISIAEKNYNVTLIEQTPTINEKPGEILHPGVEPILEKLGVLNQFMATKFLQHDGYFINWNLQSSFQSFHDDLDWKGFQIWRPAFDSILFEQAKKLGVRIIPACKAISPILKNNKVIGINTNLGIIYSNTLIDASGRQHWLSRQLNIPMINYSDKIIVHFGYLKGDIKFEAQVLTIKF